MIEPEVGHHFLELPLAADGAGDSLGLQLRAELDDAAELFLDFLANRGAVGARLRHRQLALRILLLGALRLKHLRVLLEEIVLILRKDCVLCHERIHRRVVDAVGMELLVNPFIETDGADALDVAGLGAEGEAIERLHYLLVGGELADVARCHLRAG